ncbi:hypothetical protein [Staphylococcus hominis]
MLLKKYFKFILVLLIIASILNISYIILYYLILYNIK